MTLSSLPLTPNNSSTTHSKYLMSCFIQSKECELKIINKDFNKSFEKIKNNLNGSVKEINRVFEFRSKVREKKMGNLINGCNKNNWEEKIKEFKSIISQFPKSINSQIDSVVNIIKKSDKKSIIQENYDPDA